MRSSGLLCATCLLLAAFPATAQIEIPATSADWILDGDTPSTLFGATAAPAGDVNDDGFDDVLIATLETINLYLGSASGLGTVPAWSFGPAGSGFVLRGFPIGDVNGDGRDDVLIGDPGHDAPFVNAGRVLLFLGSGSGLEAAPAWMLEGDRDGRSLGEYAGGGDIDGDGLSDVAVLEFDVVLFFRGTVAGLDAAPGWTILSQKPSVFLAGFHSNRLAVQDLNGDGYADLAYTTLEVHGLSTGGRLLGHRGSAQGPRSAREIDLDYEGSDLLATAYTAGDVDGDGRGDLLLAMYSGHGAFPEPGLSEPESVLLLKGARAALRLAHRPLIDGIPSNSLEQAGSAGDLNGDGYDDLLVAENYHPLTGSPRHSVKLYTGGPHGPGRFPAAIIVPTHVFELVPFWASTGRAGDVNGDGYGDVMVGVPFGAGRVYVFHGSPSLPGSGPGGRIDRDPSLGLQ